MILGDTDFLAQEEAQVRVLVVDDEVASQIVMKSILNSHCCVDVASNGSEAVEFFVQSLNDKRPYDLIFMDIQMPKMDGYMITREIRTLKNNKKANIPIVAMTANAFEEDRKKAFDAGMDGHIAKPIDIEKLKAAILRMGF